MKKVILLVLLFQFNPSRQVQACTCLDPPHDFYGTVLKSYNLLGTIPTIYKFYVIDYLPSQNGYRFKVTNQYGNTSSPMPDTVVFRNGNGIDCMAGFPGYPNVDTFIGLMGAWPDTNTQYNPIILPGQYQATLCGVPFMPVVNDSVYWFRNADFTYTGFSLEDLQDSLDKIYSNPPAPPVGIENINANNKILKAYPNPAHDIIQLSVENTTLRSAVICDITGRALLNKRLSKTAESIDISALAKGIYIIRCEDKEGRVFVSKVVKE